MEDQRFAVVARLELISPSGHVHHSDTQVFDPNEPLALEALQDRFFKRQQMILRAQGKSAKVYLCEDPSTVGDPDRIIAASPELALAEYIETVLENPEGYGQGDGAPRRFPAWAKAESDSTDRAEATIEFPELPD